MIWVFKKFIFDFIHTFINYVIIHIPIHFIRRSFLFLFGLRIPFSSRLGYSTKIFAPWRIKIGNRTVINEYCHLDGRGGLIIGDDCSISNYSRIISASHKVHSNNFDYIKNKVTINDKVWLGTGATILDGSNLGEGTVIGVSCVFKGDSERMSIYVGNPAKHIGRRNITEKFRHMVNPSFF